MKFRTVPLALCLLALAACGGGGDGSGPSTLPGSGSGGSQVVNVASSSEGALADSNAANNLAEDVIDGNNSTFWMATAGGQFVRVKFDGVQAIERLELRLSRNSLYPTSGFKVEFSTDNVVWNETAKTSGVATPCSSLTGSGQLRVCNFDAILTAADLLTQVLEISAFAEQDN